MAISCWNHCRLAAIAAVIVLGTIAVGAVAVTASPGDTAHVAHTGTTLLAQDEPTDPDDESDGPGALQEPVPVIDGVTPQDLTGDGRYEDLTGNGALDFADVVTFFEHLDSDPVRANSAYFDYNGNDMIDFDDVTVLFGAVGLEDPTTEIAPREPAPTDDFLATIDVDTTTVDAGAEVVFRARDDSGEDQSVHDVEWSFGDGSTASGGEVTHVFDEPGSYEVSLVATGDYGATTTHSIVMEVEEVDEVVWCDGTSPDTDGDGIPDCPEEHYDHLFPNADPLVFDVYVEVIYLGEAFPLTDQEIAELEQVFTDSPHVNPNGETGIDLHVVDGGQVSYMGEYEFFEYHEQRNPVLECAGYHSGFVADRSLGDAGGYGINGVFDVLEPNWQQNIFLHELGHSLGLTDNFDGIDSDRYTLEEYPSSMNYNGAYAMLGFSDGTNSPVDFDDWAVITGDGGYRPGWGGPGCTDDRDLELPVVG